MIINVNKLNLDGLKQEVTYALRQFLLRKPSHETVDGKNSRCRGKHSLIYFLCFVTKI